MLLPSALPCVDGARNLRPLSSHLPASKLFSSPPASDISDDETTSPTAANTSSTLLNTCRALHSILSSTPPPHSLTPPKRSSHKPSTTIVTPAPAPQLRIAKPKPPPTRGPNKRRRPLDDEEDISDNSTTTKRARTTDERLFMTPVRLYPVPTILPRGLARADFDGLRESASVDIGKDEQQPIQGTECESERGQGDSWSAEQDRVLVELVLEKLKLTKCDWVDCARTLGKDRGSVGRRWKCLVGEGYVGLKNGNTGRNIGRGGGRRR